MCAPCFSAIPAASGRAISGTWIFAGKTERNIPFTAMKRNRTLPTATKHSTRNRPISGGTASITIRTTRFLPWDWKTCRALRSFRMKTCAVTSSVSKAACAWALRGVILPRKWASSWWPRRRAKSPLICSFRNSGNLSARSATCPMMKTSLPICRKRKSRPTT